MKNTVYLSSFAGSDADKLAAASAYLKEHPHTVLKIEPGVYTLTSELARRTRREVMDGVYGNNPESYMFSPDYPYTVGLLFEDIHDAIIDARDALFLVDGFPEPIRLSHCKNVTLIGFTMDYKRKPYSKGVVTNVEHADDGKHYLTVRFGDEYPITQKAPCPRYALYDKKSCRYYDFGKFNLYDRELIAPQTIRFLADTVKDEYIGMEFYGWHTFHGRPGIFLWESEKITLRGVTIHAHAGMGIVAHRCRDLCFDSVSVVPSRGEHMSTNTDATHIASCRGYLIYKNCRFEGQGDDSLNVHTYYHKILNADGTRCTLGFGFASGTHSQMLDHPDVGDTLELTRYDTLEVCGRYVVKDVICREKELICDVVLDNELPKDTDAYVFADADACPVLIFRGCTLRNHIARGILVKTKRALIEGNTFVDLDGTAIEVSAESWWYEGIASTERIIIRRNTIINCSHRIRARECGGIAVLADCTDPTHTTHAHIIIEGNRVDCPETKYGIYVANALKAELKDNLVTGEDAIHIE